MFFEIEQFLKKLFRPLNSDELLIRILGLSRAKGPSDEPGLVMVQIDGLGFSQFHRAMREGMLPKTRSLLEKEGYSVKRMYSGIPSSTPSVQGELFYGVKMCVPAFSFKDKKTGKHFKMLDPEAAGVLEKRLESSGEPLLRGGSSYGNIFTGGAEEAHFCVSAIGWSRLFRKAGIFGFFVSLFLHLNVFISFVIGLLAEITVALFDSLRAVFLLKDPVNGLQLAPLRALMRILARDIACIGAKTDMTRGLPVIHLNIAGYDEQAHYRGPSSPLSRFFLLGIDRAVYGLWKAAARSQSRDYEFIIYSDHGQEDTAFYGREFGWGIQSAITSVFQQIESTVSWRTLIRPHGRHWRPGILRNKPGDPKKMKAMHAAGGLHAEVEAIGPVGHVYTPVTVSDTEKDLLAGGLVLSAGIPAVMYMYGGKPHFRTQEGRFLLPNNADVLISRGHPFFGRAALDLADLCRHKDSGQLILVGYRKNKKAVTFLLENGSHAGPGPDETSGFVMLAGRAASYAEGSRTLDVTGLREIAFKAKAGSADKAIMVPVAGRQKAKGNTVRIMSYNVHGCSGRDGLISPERIARVIAAHDPDIICLQELKASEEFHQAHIIAELLSMTAHYHAPVRLKTGWHGNAIISRLPMKLVHKGVLPRAGKSRMSEPRGAIWVEAELNGARIQVINTHLSFFPQEQVMQVKALGSRGWAGNGRFKKPAVICGDFNAALWSRACRAMGRQFRNVQQEKKGRRRTFPSFMPFETIDHIYVDKDTKASAVKTPVTRLERKASDHLPIAADITI